MVTMVMEGTINELYSLRVKLENTWITGCSRSLKLRMSIMILLLNTHTHFEADLSCFFETK